MLWEVWIGLIFLGGGLVFWFLLMFPLEFCVVCVVVLVSGWRLLLICFLSLILVFVDFLRFYSCLLDRFSGAVDFLDLVIS